MKYDIEEINLASAGQKRIEWADNDMPGLREIRKRFEKEKPLKDKKLSACLHITAETANLARTLKLAFLSFAVTLSGLLRLKERLFTPTRMKVKRGCLHILDWKIY